MKRMTAKRGLAALMAVLMGASIFTTTGAIGVSAGGPGDVNATAVMSTSLAKCKDGDKISTNESIDNIIKNYIKPIFKVMGIRASNKDLRTMALLWKKLNFNENQSNFLGACLVKAMEQTKENSNYLDHIYRYYNLENVRLANDGIFIKIIGALTLLLGSGDYEYYQIRKILRIIHSYVY